MRTLLMIHAVVIAIAIAPACNALRVFHCASNVECEADGVTGVCQSTGYCSFPAEGCDSQQRYGELAPLHLAGTCVPTPIDPGDSQSDGVAGSEGGGPGGSDASSDGGTDPDPPYPQTADASSGVVDGGETETGSPEPACGNGVVDPDEVCDGDDFAGRACADYAFPAGELACDATCSSIDASACTGCGTPVAAPGGATCPDQCDSCQGNLCLIECDASSSCTGDTLQCPDGWDCDVTCSGDQACFVAEIHGPAVHRLSITCEGVSACEDAVIECGLGVCELSCGGDIDACRNAEHHCGAQSCTTTCAGEGDDAAPDTDCASACSCIECSD